MTDEVKQWLESIGLPQYVNHFLENGYDDMDSLWDLNSDDLDAIGIKLPGHRKKILIQASKFSTDTQGDWEVQTSQEEAPPVSEPPPESDDGEDLNDAIWKLGTLLGELSEFTGEEPVIFNPQLTRAKISDSSGPRTSVYTTDTLEESTREDGNIDLDDLLEDLYSFNPAEELAKIQLNRGMVEKEASNLRYIPPPPLTKSLDAGDLLSTNFRAQTLVSPRKSTSMDFPANPEPEPEDRDIVPSSMSRSKTLFQAKQQISTDPTQLLATPPHLRPEQVKVRLEELSSTLQSDPSLSSAEREQRLKEEKIKIALEKMKVASKQKIVIKAFNEDMSSKTVVVDDDMQSWYVSQMLIMKNHTSDSPNWGLIEFLPEFSLQRMLEDHETVVDAYQAWPRETQNMFIFKNDEYKYDLFHRPYEYFPAELCLSSEQAKNTKDPRTERARKMLINEYFSEQGRIPELEGLLFIKEGKKPWKRLFVLLRGSGIYYSNRGKSKQSKHLVSFCSINDHDVYIANNYKKIVSAPKNYCFVLKPQGRHLTVGWSDLKYFCAPNKRLMFSWIAGIRLVKHGGPQLKDNFVSMQNKEYKLSQIEREDQLQESTSPPHHTSQLNRMSSLPANSSTIGTGAIISSVDARKTLSYSASQPHEPTPPVPYSQTPHRISIISPTEPPQAPELPSISAQHPGAFPMSTPTTQLPLQEPKHIGVQPYPVPVSHKLPVPTPPPASALQAQPSPPPPQQQKPIAPKPSKKPLFIPRSEQGSKYNPRLALPPFPGGTPALVPSQTGPLVLPTPNIPEKKKPVSHQIPIPQLISQQVPTPHSVQNLNTNQLSTANPVQHPITPKPKPAVTPEVTNIFQDKSWFHGPIARDEAARRISLMGKEDGIFLVRESTTYRGSYVLTMLSQGQLRNFQIQNHGTPDNAMYGIDDGPRFYSVDEMIQHYSCFDDRLPCKLTHTCLKPDFSTRC